MTDFVFEHCGRIHCRHSPKGDHISLKLVDERETKQTGCCEVKVTGDEDLSRL
jgi:hypothetical protein